MGLINIQDVIADQIGDTVIGARAQCYVFAEGSDNLVPIFAGIDLEETQKNPLMSDENGMFGSCWVINGKYRLVVITERGERVAEANGVSVTLSSILGYERGFSNRAQLIKDTQFAYDVGENHWTVTPGCLVRQTDINGVYQVASADSADSHLVTQGGVKFFVQRDERGLNVKMFGAVGDGITDDSAAIQAAINAAAQSGGGKIYLPVGVYRCASTIKVFHAADNPRFPDHQLLAGRLTIEGDGAMTRRDYNRETFIGSVIAFDPGQRLELSKVGSSDQRGWRLRLCQLSILGSNGTLVHHPYAGSFSELEGLFIGNDGAVADEATVYLSDNYVGRLQDIEIIGDKALSGRVGIGLHIDPSDTAGGGNSFINITAAYFDHAIMIGREYDPARLSITDNFKAIVCQNLQGQWSNTGIHLMQGCTNTTLIGCWSEHCRIAPIRIDNSARNIEVVSTNASLSSGQIGGRGLVIIGNTTGFPGVDAAYNINIRNSMFFCTAGSAGVFVCNAARDVVIDNNTFYNAGGAALGVDGEVGGEITLQGNNYFPEGAQSEVPVVRRFCRVQGTFEAANYTDVSHMALVLDFRPVALKASIDASGWRRPPQQLVFDTLSGSLSVTLPDLRAAGGRAAQIRVMKPYAANDVTIDVQAGNTIRGAQTLVMSSAYSSIELVHGGNFSSRWDVVQQT